MRQSIRYKFTLLFTIFFLIVGYLQGIVRASRSLRDAVADGATNLEAREDMAVASVMGGLCLANAKLGVCITLAFTTCA